MGDEKERTGKNGRGSAARHGEDGGWDLIFQTVDSGMPTLLMFSRSPRFEKK